MACLRIQCITAIVAIIGFALPCTKAFPAAAHPHPCAQAAPPQTQLDLNSTVLAVQARPWGLAYLNDNIAFAAINFSIGVLDTSQFAPKLMHMLPLPPAFLIGNDDPNADGYGLREMTLTHDKENLYVATGYGAIILDVPRALQGRNDSFVGVLSHDGYAGRSAIEASITADDKFAFISQEYGSNVTHNLGAIEVYKITRQQNRTVTSTWKGFIGLGFRTIGQQFSTDQSRLFVTSEINGTARSLNQTGGLISVLDVETLKAKPARSLIKNVPGGCHPVRSTLSIDGKQLWVSTRESNQVLAFDTDKLADETTADPLLAQVDTGTAPLGITAIRDYIFVADSNRWNYSDTTAGVSVVNIGDALRKGYVNFPQIPTSAFPRTVVASPSGNTLLVSEFDAASIRAVDISSLSAS
ncbi:uncharacterized protein JN550_002767 [Neoarthrinium moseri]|uniref:uncharacterized protein n=1 Tax=Neoarthrinium moseri TaxID=1658444 RepID=UPI001FDC9BE2|nr:uncharacterized protein JN550_002767 [Neoarthrinium moseri]KAI1874188.1 hypothetical protein JN550_002767 [Neoarthrinium moseri]